MKKRHRVIGSPSVRRTGWQGIALISGSFIVLCFAACKGKDGNSSRSAESSLSDGPCTKTAKNALKACRYEALADYWLALAKCENMASREERAACKAEARAALEEAREECADQSDARRDLCDELGEDTYEPMIDPANFVGEINNPFLPLMPGTTLVYEGETEDGLERIEVKVTDEKKEILGVQCTVVRDTVRLNGEVIEDTFDWFAQDTLGNVWYFGELSYELEDDVIVSLAGSWEAGVDGAKPGIVMKADPQVGETYRQEFLLGEAEDIGKVLAFNQEVMVPFGAFGGCLQTQDTSPLEPDALEHKYYAPGLGLVLEVNPEDDERIELIDVIME